MRAARKECSKPVQARRRRKYEVPVPGRRGVRRECVESLKPKGSSSSSREGGER